MEVLAPKWAKGIFLKPVLLHLCLLLPSPVSLFRHFFIFHPLNEFEIPQTYGVSVYALYLCFIRRKKRMLFHPFQEQTFAPLGGTVVSVENVCFRANRLGLEKEVEEEDRENPGDGQEGRFTPECGPWTSSTIIFQRGLAMQIPIPPIPPEQASVFYQDGEQEVGLDALP